jgi:hypothetical protein
MIYDLNVFRKRTDIVTFDHSESPSIGFCQDAYVLGFAMDSCKEIKPGLFRTRFVYEGA